MRRGAVRFAVRAAFGAALLWCAFIEIVEAVAYALFGMELDGDWYLLLTGTSLSDRLQFIRMYAWPIVGALAAFAAVAAFAAWTVLSASRKAFAIAAVAVVSLALVRINHVGAFRAWKPVYVAFDTFRSAREYGQVGEAGRWTPEREAAVRPAPEGATNYVFVIGESLTTARIQFFGYGKTTMPRLAALGDRLAAYGPVRAPSPYTVRSLMDLFISDGAAAPVWFRQAGYRTGYVSAHERWGRYCSVEAAVFAACERKVYLSDIAGEEKIYDDRLLPYAAEMMKKEPFVLFIHMIGSHFQPGTRVPSAFAADEGLDDYDRSVRYTDEILGRLIASLPPRTELIYISDHGESVDSGGWRNFASDALWSVPVFVYPASASPAIRSVADFVAAWRARAGVSAEGGENGRRDVGQ